MVSDEQFHYQSTPCCNSVPLPHVACYNLDRCEPFLVTFGTNVNHKVNNQKLLYFSLHLTSTSALRGTSCVTSPTNQLLHYFVKQNTEITSVYFIAALPHSR